MVTDPVAEGPDASWGGWFAHFTPVPLEAGRMLDPMHYYAVHI